MIFDFTPTVNRRVRGEGAENTEKKLCELRVFSVFSAV
jgi:hypothetical protein